MLARKITASERPDAELIQSIAFFYPFDPKEGEKAPDAPPKKPGIYDVWASFDDAGRMTGTVVNHAFSTYYDGHIVPSGGIGGVASLPEHRAQGGIREVLRAILKEDREKGVLFSLLFPFSHPFYRRFGYELCHEGRMLRFSVRALKEYRQDIAVRMHRQSEGDAPFRGVYDAYARQFCYALAREDGAWSRMLRGTPEEAKAYRYLLSREGRDVAYCMLHTTRVTDYALMLWIDDWAYVDKAALYALLGFLYRFSAQCEKVCMEVPDGFEMGALLDEPYDVEQVAFRRSMARVLNVEEALKKMRHPAEEGAYTLSVEDAFLPENTGVYRVSFGAGETRVCRAPGETPDASMHVQTLAQLCFGYMGFDMAAFKRDVETAGNLETLRRVFVRKPRFLSDRF